jgi:NodT family efflux transporter outer membrane factor (OMF) lipoprotein
MMSRITALAFAAALAAGCAATGSRVTAPALVDSGQLAGVRANANANVPAVAEQWWRAFGDPQLDALVDEALAQSPTLIAAQARLESAAALARAARGARLPTASLGASVERQRLSEKGLYPPPYAGATLNIGQLGVDVSYELDLVGRVRERAAAREASAAAARNDLAAARLGLAAAVSRAYLKLGRSYALDDTLRDAAERRRQLLQLTEQRVSAGLDTQFEVEAERAAVASAESDLAAAAEDRALLANELAALVGAGPGRGASVLRPTFSTPAAVALPDELPADLIGRRPDVAADRARVQAAAADVKVAEDDFYPNINLAAFAGFQSVELGSLVSNGTRAWNAGPAITLPLFFTQQLRGQLGARDADYAGAVARYNSTVIDAFHEVADAVATLRYLGREQAANATAVAAFERAYQLALVRYRAGLTNYLTVLIAEENLLTQRRVAVDLDARRADLAVALFRALGGGFAT